MKAMRWSSLSIVLAGACMLGVVLAGAALAQSNWVDEITNSLAFYKTNYPTSNWDIYQQKLNLVRDAVNRGDQRTVKVEMNKFFRMLQGRANGINDVAAEELSNFAAMVTPIQEYGISVPTAMPGQ